jgi:hypothetical protein
MYYYNNFKVPSLLKEVTRWAIAEASATASPSPQLFSERLGSDSKGDLWIRSFLINSKPNTRGWAVDPSTIRNNVLSIIGKPLVIDRNPVTQKIDHPQWDSSQSAQANYISQSRKAVGVVEKVFYDAETDSYYADSRVTDPKAKEYINSFKVGNNSSGRKVPIPVSPQLVYNPKTESPNYYRDWNFTHLAIVDKGAYGPQAQVIGTCNGEAEVCQQKLQQQAMLAASAPAVAAISAAASSAYAPPTTAAASASELELKRKIPSQDYGGFGGLRAPSNGKRFGRLA